MLFLLVDPNAPKVNGFSNGATHTGDVELDDLRKPRVAEADDLPAKVDDAGGDSSKQGSEDGEEKKPPEEVKQVGAAEVVSTGVSKFMRRLLYEFIILSR